jgi:hypothetical protein
MHLSTVTPCPCTVLFSVRRLSILLLKYSALLFSQHKISNKHFVQSFFFKLESINLLMSYRLTL